MNENQRDFCETIGVDPDELLQPVKIFPRRKDMSFDKYKIHEYARWYAHYFGCGVIPMSPVFLGQKTGKFPSSRCNKWVLDSTGERIPMVDEYGNVVYDQYGKVVYQFECGGSRVASTDIELLYKWFIDDEYLPDKPCNHLGIGLATGRGGIIVIDPDGEDGKRNLVLLQEKYGELPKTLTATSGSGVGKHYYFRHPKDEKENYIPIKNASNYIAPHVDVQGDGGMVIAEPTLHYSGGRYHFDTCPEDTEIAEFPKQYIDLLNIPKWIYRNDGLFEEEKKQYQSQIENRKKGIGKDTKPKYVNMNYAKKFYLLISESDEVEEIYCEKQSPSSNNYVGNCPWHSSRSKRSLIIWYDGGKMDSFKCWGCDTKGAVISQDEVDDLENQNMSNIKTILLDRLKRKQKKYNLTDVGNAQRFVDKYSDRIRFVEQEKRWYQYDGIRWTSENASAIVHRYAIEIAKSIHAEAINCNNEHRDALLRWAKRSESASAMNSMLNIAQHLEQINISSTDFNKDIYLLNCLNGTIDLKTGWLWEHNPDDLITNLAPVIYDADAKAERWVICLDQWMIGNQNKIQYLQNLLGICLTGDRRCRVFPIFIGLGKNGKNIFLEAICSILGTYAGKAPEFLLVRSNNPKNTEIMTLKDKRLVIASETKEGMVIDTRLVKEMTGDKQGTGRGLYQDYVTFDYTHKCILMTNHEPYIGTDKAMWDRIHKVTWDKEFTKDEQDRLLDEKLQKEYSGILNWLLEGCRRWFEIEDLVAPPEIVHSTQEYRNDSHPLSQFMEECCEVGICAYVRVGELYEAYERWVGKHPISKKKFGEEMKNLKYEQKNKNIGHKIYRCWIGITLNDDGQSYLKKDTYFSGTGDSKNFEADW